MVIRKRICNSASAGCKQCCSSGAFGNDVHVISNRFYKALKEIDYNRHVEKDLFRRIDFAVLDKTDDQYNFKEFYRNFSFENFFRNENQQAIDEAMERIRKTEVHLGQIRGCLLGGAVGDAVGYAIEEKWRTNLELKDVIMWVLFDDTTFKAYESQIEHWEVSEIVQSPDFYSINKMLRDGGI